MFSQKVKIANNEVKDIPVVDFSSIELIEHDFDLQTGEWKVFFEKMARKVLFAITPHKKNIYIGGSSCSSAGDLCRSLSLIEIGSSDLTDSLNQKERNQFITCLSFIQYQCAKSVLKPNDENNYYETDAGDYRAQLRYEIESAKQFYLLVKEHDEAYIDQCIKEYLTAFNYSLLFNKIMVEQCPGLILDSTLCLDDKGKFYIEVFCVLWDLKPTLNAFLNEFQKDYSCEVTSTDPLQDFYHFFLQDFVAHLSEEEQSKIQEIVSLESKKNELYNQIDLITELIREEETNEAKDEAEKLGVYKLMIPNIEKYVSQHSEQKPLFYAVRSGGNLHLISKLVSLGCSTEPLKKLISYAEKYSTPAVKGYLQNLPYDYLRFYKGIQNHLSNMMQEESEQSIAKNQRSLSRNP